MMNYQSKYINRSRAVKRNRRTTPELWVSGPDPITHDKYYAWLKHKAQAKYRKEEYHLTWEEWQNIWTPDIWMQRGRASDDLCLGRLDHLGPWSVDNCHIITRKEHLARQGEFVRGK